MNGELLRASNGMGAPPERASDVRQHAAVSWGDGCNGGELTFSEAT